MTKSNIRLGFPISVVVGTVESRPSRVIKTPYVCDMKVLNGVINDDKKGSICLGHTPSLGCNGMVDKGATVIAVNRKRNSQEETETITKRNGKCDYGVIASVITEKETTYVVGVDPSIAEQFAGEILMTGVIPGLSVSKSNHLQTQKTYNDCRFDYCGVTDDGSPFICEVKNVSIANYEDLPPKQLAKMDFSSRDIGSKVAVFPSGYKPKGQTHSERALKHTRTLKEIKQAHHDSKMRCIILFVIQRDDVCIFQPSNGDEQYRRELREAFDVGVEVYAVRVKWLYEPTLSQLTPIVVYDNKTMSPLLPVTFS